MGSLDERRRLPCYGEQNKTRVHKRERKERTYRAFKFSNSIRTRTSGRTMRPFGVNTIPNTSFQSSNLGITGGNLETRMGRFEIFDRHVNGRRDFKKEWMRKESRDELIKSRSFIYQVVESSTDYARCIQIANSVESRKGFASKLNMILERAFGWHSRRSGVGRHKRGKNECRKTENMGSF